MSWSTDLTDDVIELENAEHRSKRRLYLAILGSTLVLLIAAMVVIAWVALHVAEPDVWDPLGDYPVQQADGEVVIPADSGLVFVRVFATKCATQDVPVVGSLGWRSIDPRGSFVNVTSESASIRRAGCAELSFSNPVPAQVVAITRANGGRMVWQIHGTEWPVRDGVLGVPREFETTPIVVRLQEG